MASLLRVDEIGTNEAAHVKFNVAAYNERHDAPSQAGTVTWNPAAFPVVEITNTGAPAPSAFTASPDVPTVNGMYMTVVYPEGSVVSFDILKFDASVEEPDCSGGPVHRVYHGADGRWWDA